MSNDTVSTLDLSLNKEYALYSDVHSVDYRTAIDQLIEKSGRLQLNTYQSFVRNLFDPSSEYTALLLIHGTGTGKTITSLAVASEYQKQYRDFMSIKKNKAYSDIHSIFIIGYTKDIFRNELISHQEFGFVSTAELAELNELQKTEHESKSIAEKVANLRNKYYRRVSDRKMNGIYSFYGYRQLFNRVVNQQDIAAQLTKRRSTEDIDIIGLDPQQIRKWIKSGKVRLNKPFIESMRNSLVICDEVHNIYYHKDVNAYGLAIEIINDYFNEPKLYNTEWTVNDENCIRWLFLSATPLTYAPTEIVPIINILNLAPYRVSQSDIFDEKTKEITNKGLSLIAQRVDKKISYVMDNNPIQYPSASFEGIPIANIPYLKFIRCKVSKQHDTATQLYLQNAPPENDEASNKTNTIKDMVFQSGTSKSKLLFRYADVVNEIRSGISPYKEDSNGYLSSDLLNVSSLETYSSKYFHLMKHLLSLKGVEHGKIFVYHPFVQSTGTNLLTSIFRANGLLEGDEHPSANSICMVCDKLYKDHQCKKSSEPCDFTGVRFVVVTGYVSKTTVANRLNQFNSADNSDGKSVKILLGSKAMRESHTLKACRHLLVTHQPASVSELIQIVGRGVRKNSHALLAPNDRNIKLYIFVSSNPNGSALSLEEADYFEKMRLYIQILRIERIMFDQSVDYLINFRFKKREVPKLIGESFGLDLNLYKKYSTDKSYSLNKLSNIKHNSFYFDQETELCRMIIKRIMLEYQPIISKSELHKLIHNPPFYVEADVSLLSDEAIEFALNEIIFNKTDSIIIDDSTKNIQSIESLFNDSKVVTNQNKSFHIKINSNEMIYIEPVSTPVDDFHKLISVSEISNEVRQIDLEDLANRWNDLVHIEDIVADIEIEFLKTKTIESSIVTRLSQFTIETHSKLLEYCIIAIINKVFKNKNIPLNAQLLIQLTEYYIDKGVTVSINDTIGTIVTAQYKKYYIHTGLTWKEIVSSSSKPTRINYISIPIGHYIKFIPRLLDLNSINGKLIIWNEYSSIIPNIAWKFPISIIGYEERSTGIDNIFKIKDLSDKSSKGINPMFMQQKDLQSIIKRLKISLKAGAKKIMVVSAIKEHLLATEAKYRKENKNNKIYFHMYETLTV